MSRVLDVATERLSRAWGMVGHLNAVADTPELRAVCHDWPSRVANYRAFLSPELKQFVRDEGFQVIGYRRLRDLLRGA